jgi:K+-transporting ATPase KdpF subunit
MMMDWTTMVALVVAVGLVIYLAAALLKPERFS